MVNTHQDLRLLIHFCRKILHFLTKSGVDRRGMASQNHHSRSSSEESIDDIVEDINRTSSRISGTALSSSPSLQNFKSKLKGIFHRGSRSTIDFNDAKKPGTSSSGDNWGEFRFLPDNVPSKVKFETCIVKPTYVDKGVQTDQFQSKVIVRFNEPAKTRTSTMAQLNAGKISDHSDDGDDPMAEVETFQLVAHRCFSLKEIFKNTLQIGGRSTPNGGYENRDTDS